jgi:hypothetical protein
MLSKVNAKSVYRFEWIFPRPITSTGFMKLRVERPAQTYPILDVIASVVRNGPQSSDYQGASLHRFNVCKAQWGVAFLWLIQQQLDFWTREDWPFLLAELRASEDSAKIDFLHFEMCKWLANYMPGASGYSNHWEHFNDLLLEAYRYSFTRPLTSKRSMRDAVKKELKEIKALSAEQDLDLFIESDLKRLIFKAQKQGPPKSKLGGIELQALIKQYQSAMQQRRALYYDEVPGFCLKVFCEKEDGLHVRVDRWATQPLVLPCGNLVRKLDSPVLTA